MQQFNIILGLLMFYGWIHSTAIIFKKIKDLTQYEKIVLIFSFVFFFLFVAGSLVKN
jgi:hypothetical protein